MAGRIARALEAGLLIRPGERRRVALMWVYAALYIFVEAMGSLVVIQFWTLANDVFHAREAKRLFGLIGGGGTLANVIFGLLVGRYAQVIGAQNLLLVMVAQLAICAGLAQAGSRTAAAGALVLRSRPVRKAPVISRAGLTFLSNKHLTIVALIGAVSAAAVTIVDFQFKLSAAAVLDQNDLAGYFGRFYGICGGVALAVQIWVTGRLLERYGILASLLPLPLGLALGSGASAASATPGLFVSSLAKGSDTIFRYTINDASMQLLYVPVAPHVRGRAKAFIDGVLKPTSVAFAGAVLLFYKQSGGRGRPLTAAVLVLVGTWVWLLTRARGEYVRSLVESLERRRLDLSSSQFSRLNEGTMRALRTARGGDGASLPRRPHGSRGRRAGGGRSGTHSPRRDRRSAGGGRTAQAAARRRGSARSRRGRRRAGEDRGQRILPPPARLPAGPGHHGAPHRDRRRRQAPGPRAHRRAGRTVRAARDGAGSGERARCLRPRDRACARGHPARRSFARGLPPRP